MLRVVGGVLIRVARRRRLDLFSRVRTKGMIGRGCESCHHWSSRLTGRRSLLQSTDCSWKATVPHMRGLTRDMMRVGGGSTMIIRAKNLRGQILHRSVG